MTQYADIADRTEDERIQIIGHNAMGHRKVVIFIVEDTGKANRYIRKLLQMFPGIQVMQKGQGPVPNTIAVKVGPPAVIPQGAA